MEGRSAQHKDEEKMEPNKKLKLGDWHRSLSRSYTNCIKLSTITGGKIDDSSTFISGKSADQEQEKILLLKNTFKSAESLLFKQDVMFWMGIMNNSLHKIPHTAICLRSYQMLSKYVALLTVNNKTDHEHYWISAFWLLKQWQQDRPLHLLHPLFQSINSEEELLGRFTYLLSQALNEKVTIILYNHVQLKSHTIARQFMFNKCQASE